MQLPFVLQSAEVMKTAVAYLEPHMEKADDGGKGRIVLATVKGDVHDIGKNLVDIILSNNGYEVVNIGIKQPISAILDAAEEHAADAIGMSGLLVKSTVIMKENLEEMNARGVADALPGAARRRGADPRRTSRTTCASVQRRRALRPGRLRGPAPDGRGDGAQAGLDPRPTPTPRTPKAAERRARRERSRRIARAREAAAEPEIDRRPARPTWPTDVAGAAPPFFGTRVVKGIPLADYAALLDERATFLGQWGLRGARGGTGPSYEELVETEGRPRLRYWLDRLHTDQVLEAAVVYGYFPAYPRATTWSCSTRTRDAPEVPGSPSRASAGSGGCAWPTSSGRGESGEVDVVALQLVTVGQPISEYAASCSPPTPTATTWRCTGCRCSSPRRWPSTGTGGSASELVFPDGGTAADDDPADLGGSSTGLPRLPVLVRLPGLPGPGGPGQVVRPARARSGSAWRCPRSSSCIPSSPPALVVHHPEANYFAAR